MICENCGAENQQGIFLCGSCGNSLPVSELVTAVDFVVRPSQWAWAVYAVPMVVVYAILMSVDVFTFGLLPVAVLGAFIIPRYITWRGSSYTFTVDSLIIKRGQLGREDKVSVLFTDIKSFDERQGFLGPTLQYTSVHIFLKENGRKGVLSYVPTDSGIVERLTAEGIAYGDPESEDTYPEEDVDTE
jgi:membrane protein YdbS with pleckstrin-like domain